MERSSSDRDWCVCQDIVFAPSVVASVKVSTQAVHVDSILLSTVYYALISAALSISDDELLSLGKYRYSASFLFVFALVSKVLIHCNHYVKCTSNMHMYHMGVKRGRLQ